MVPSSIHEPRAVISLLDYSIINNNWMRFCDLQNNQGQSKCNQPMLEAETLFIPDIDHKNRIQLLFYYTLFYGKYTTTTSVWSASRFYLHFKKYKDKCTKRPHHSKPVRCSRFLAQGVLCMRTTHGKICRYNWIADYSIIMLVHKIMWILKISRGFLANQRADSEYNISYSLHAKLSLFAYVISGERSANRPKQLRNVAFHVKTSQSAKN